MYSIIIEFEKNRYTADADTSDAESYFSSSDEELEHIKDKQRASADRDRVLNDSFFSDEKKAKAIEEEHVKNAAMNTEKKDPYRRGINHKGPGVVSAVFSKLDKGVQEKRGRREELKILETHNKTRIKKQLLLIRKFLKMDVKHIEVADERTSGLRTRDDEDEEDDD
jgi:hypothetical protein